MNNKLIKASFIQKIVSQRLDWKYRITDIDYNEMDKLYHEYKDMIAQANYEQELLNTLPISKVSFNTMRNELIERMKKVGLAPQEANLDNVKISYVNAILESFLYAHKTYLFCTVVHPNAKLLNFKDLESVRGPFIKEGYDTLLDLALIYDNNISAKNIKNVGPVKFRKFQEFFALKMGINVIDKSIKIRSR